MALPIKTAADDVRAVVKYLKTKPAGATPAEAKAVAKRTFDGRKLTAYVAWGVVMREDGKFKLGDRGWDLARHPERDAEVFREIVSLMKPYHSVIEWAFHQDMKMLTTNDVGSQWHEHHREAVGDANENTLRENAVCFFNVAEAGGLGTLTLGRGGQPTRLELDRATLATFVEAGPATPPWQDTDGIDAEAGEIREGADEGQADEEPSVDEKPEPTVVSDALRVFISHGSNHDIVEQIELMLGVADIEPEIAIAEETAAIPVPEKVLNAMRRCQAGIIAVTVDEQRKDEEGNFTLNENVLIEIGAAFVLYDRRVVLVWDKRLRVPSNLQGLYRCEFEGDELSWKEGMKLLRAIQGFKKPTE